MLEVCEQLKMSKRKYNRLMQRIKRNNSTIMFKKGKTSSITDEHIQFLKEWFDNKDNVGKPFKWAFKALKIYFSFDQQGITIKQRACYN